MISFTAEQRFIVTGASSGIGEGTALLLNELGATVIAVGRNLGRLNCLKEKCREPAKMCLEQKDLIDDVAGLPAYIKELRCRYGKFSGLAYCAGVTELSPLQLWDFEKELLLFKVNYFAPIAMLKGVCDRRNNVGKGTSCVVVASASSRLADKGHCAYAGSKSAVTCSCRVIAKETAALGVRINTVSPSIIATPMTNGDGGDYLAAQSGKYPMGVGAVSDVANQIVFLLSEKASWLSGQDYVVDGASF